MPFICANCRRMRMENIDVPLCANCTQVRLLLADMPEPQPFVISAAPEEPKPKTITDRNIRHVDDPLRSVGEWYEETAPTSNFPILEYSYWWDHPPDYPYVDDFTLSKEKRYYMKTQIELEFDNMPELDIVEPCGIYWIRKRA